MVFFNIRQIYFPEFIYYEGDSSSGTHVAPFTNKVYFLIPAWISYHMASKVWAEITYPFLNFNGANVEV